MKPLLLVALLLCAACPPTPPVPTPGEATCADVCHHYQVLGCAIAQPTSEGASCVDVCKVVQESNVISWNLQCRAHAETCEAVERCERAP